MPTGELPPVLIHVYQKIPDMYSTALQKHCKKENEKSISENFCFHPFGNIFFSGKSESAAYQAEKLTPTAIFAAVAFTFSKN